MSSLLRSATSVFSGRIVITAIGFIFTPILVRLISQEHYGIYATVLAAFSIVSLISRGGIFDATRKIVAENRTEKQQSRIVSTAIVLSLTYAAVFMPIVWLILHIEIVPKQYTAYIPILAIGLIFMNIFSVIRGSFYGQHAEHTSEILQVIQTGTYNFLVVIFLILGGGLWSVFLGYSSSYIVATIIGLYILAKTFHLEIPNKSVFRDYGKELFGYGTTQLVGGLSALLLYKTDILLVEYFLGSSTTALYKAALLPAEYVWLIPSVIQAVFLQHAADFWSQNNIPAINDQLATGLKYAILSLSLFGIGLFPLSAAFLGVYFGEQYTEGYISLQILLCGTIFFGMSRVMIPVFQATGWVRYTELMTLITLILNVILNIRLIPQYEIVGAAIGTAISYSFMILWSIVIWHRSEFKFPNGRLVSKWIAPQIVYALIYITIVQLLDLERLISLIVFPMIGLVIFTIVNQMAGIINIYDAKKDVIDIL